MTDIYLKYYEENTRKIFEDELGEIKSFEYLKYTKDFYYELKSNVFIGKVDKRNEFAFLLQEKEDIYIDKIEAKDLMNDDIVLIEVKRNKAYVKEILKRGLRFIIAEAKKRKKGFKYYTEKPLFKNILVNDESNIIEGSIVRLEVVTIKNNRIYTNLDKIVGHKTDPDIDILKIVAINNWPDPDMSLLEDEAINLNVNLEDEIKKRKDYTNKLIVTIDGKDAKDLDDAISLELKDDKYYLGVHIADVSLYVKRNSLIDKEAYKKGTSAYLANKVIPMLPRKLSNDLCSLNPNTKKLTLSLMMEIDKLGKVLNYEISNSVIESKYRLNYDDVNNYLNNNVSLGNNELDSLLTNMYELSNILKKDRVKRGELNFESEELEFKFNDKNEVIDVFPRKSDKGEEIIESFMLKANETIAFHMEVNNLPSIYRIHEKPDTEKLENALDTLNKLNIKINKKAIHNVKTFQNILKDVKDTNYEYITNMTLLRAMQKAKYSNEPIGHFGLAARHYTHFTSPIRRYPDLLLHRIIKDLILGESNYIKAFKYYENNLVEIADHTSRQERTAILMEREVNQLKSCEYMKDKIYERFDAQITQILKTGMFVRIDKGIEGFVNIKNGNYHGEYIDHLLSYKVNGKLYKIGDKVNVELIDVDMLELKIDFKLLDEGEESENNS